MRLLVLSSFYPPHHLGGYELACRDAVNGLRARGHEVEVLTTTFRTPPTTEPEEDGVARDLTLFWSDGAWIRPELAESARATRSDLDAMDRAIERHRPEAIWAWQLSGLSKALLSEAARMGVPVVLAVHDEWPRYETDDPWFAQLHGPGREAARAEARRLELPTRPPRLRRLAGASFNSGWLRSRLGRRVPSGPVIPPAVDLARFTPGPEPEPVRRFLHLGRVEPRKGATVAVWALHLLREHGFADATLTLAGPTEGAHLDEVMALVGELGQEEAIRYAGIVPRREVPGLYRAHDAVIHSAWWDEPFGLVLVEAMATGRPVVASVTGGAAEIVQAGRNALTFTRLDANSAAEAMRRLASEPELVHDLVRAGLRTASNYSVEAMVDAHERHLIATLERR